MAKHRVKAKGRTEDGKSVDMLFPTIAPMVECAVENESGGTSVIPLDELLADYAEEINQNTAQMLPM